MFVLAMKIFPAVRGVKCQRVKFVARIMVPLEKLFLIDVRRVLDMHAVRAALEIA